MLLPAVVVQARPAVQEAQLREVAAVLAEGAQVLLLAVVVQVRPAVQVAPLREVAAVPAEGALVPLLAVVVQARPAVLQAPAVWPLSLRRRPSLREHRLAGLQ